MLASGESASTGSKLDDSVDRDLAGWLAELPDADPEIEGIRMRLLRCGRLLDRLLVGIARRYDLTLGDWEALSVLRRSGDPYELSPSDLARQLEITSGTMSVRIERLLRAGLVEHSGTSTDGRSRPIRLTPAGNERWRGATEDRLIAERRIITETLEPGDHAAANDILRQLLAALERHVGSGSRRVSDEHAPSGLHEDDIR